MKNNIMSSGGIKVNGASITIKYFGEELNTEIEAIKNNIKNQWLREKGIIFSDQSLYHLISVRVIGHQRGINKLVENLKKRFGNDNITFKKLIL